jgi:hypothetical protein
MSIWCAIVLPSEMSSVVMPRSLAVRTWKEQGGNCVSSAQQYYVDGLSGWEREIVAIR